MQYFLLFHCNNGYANAPRCYVIRTVTVLQPLHFSFYSNLSHFPFMLHAPSTWTSYISYSWIWTFPEGHVCLYPFRLECAPYWITLAASATTWLATSSHRHHRCHRITSSIHRTTVSRSQGWPVPSGCLTHWTQCIQLSGFHKVSAWRKATQLASLNLYSLTVFTQV
jgi:hypothetical protein